MNVKPLMIFSLESVRLTLQGGRQYTAIGRQLGEGVQW